MRFATSGRGSGVIAGFMGCTKDPVAALRALVAEMADRAPTKLAMAGHLLVDGRLDGPARAAAERMGAVVGEVLERAQRTGRIRGDVGVDEIHFLVRGIAQAQA